MASNLLIEILVQSTISEFHANKIKCGKYETTNNFLCVSQIINKSYLSDHLLLV